MSRPLVIVESPAKAKTIAGILGRDFLVESSVGHVRDLPAAAAEIPAAYKGESWAHLGVDVDNDFKPLYVVSSRKKSQVKKLKSLMKEASELYLATDEDREGESIAWHLLEVLSPRIPVKRMVFHEITKEAIHQAVEHPRDLDRRLVDAQEARRILDRLFGYEVSPVLWKKVAPKLSAGRVQSVATRILVERERARMRFTSASFWNLEATLAPQEASRADASKAPFVSLMVSADGRRVATSRDFDESGQLTRDVLVLDEGAATQLAVKLRAAHFKVDSVEKKPFTRSPYAPFITSTLQQEASRKLHFGSQRTMQVAQRLYENGYITYMRTDSVVLSQTAIDAARQQASQLYGSEYVPAQPRRYKSKVRNAQEAHEAIRPAGTTFRMPDEVARELSGDEIRLYDLIWKRTVASQMNDARGQSVQVRIVAETSSEQGEFVARGNTITFPGFRRAYVEGADDPEAALEDQEVLLPPLTAGQVLTPTAVDAKGHSTVPPARFSEASLVKKLEELGVGRPSTYASIIATIQDRGYVWKKGTALVPSFLAFAVVGLLEKHFSEFIDYGFTADMEEDLDEIAGGDQEHIPWLSHFYFGNGNRGLKDMVGRLDEIDPVAINSIPVGKDGEGREIVVRVGRYGPYLQRGDERVSVPDDMAPDEITPQRAEELLSAPSEDRSLGEDPKSGRPVYVRAGRFGPYVQLGEPENDSGKPPRASLFSSMEPASVTLEQALKLLSLPRPVGSDPSDGTEIVALNGRYGPYLKKGADTRTLASEDQIFTVTLDEALALFAQPKTGRRRGGSAALKEMGPDPESGKPILLKEGRFGPYVTDGTTNASLPRGEAVDSINLERSIELLAEKRANPPKKKTTRRKTARRKTKT
ncbi:MAG: topoisomerase [Actinomycetota bacterium]|nr:topoisomerase [Actinomycetota bacterium]